MQASLKNIISVSSSDDCNLQSKLQIKIELKFFERLICYPTNNLTFVRLLVAEVFRAHPEILGKPCNLHQRVEKISGRVPLARILHFLCENPAKDGLAINYRVAGGADVSHSRVRAQGVSLTLNDKETTGLCTRAVTSLTLQQQQQSSRLRYRTVPAGAVLVYHCVKTYKKRI